MVPRTGIVPDFWGKFHISGAWIFGHPDIWISEYLDSSKNKFCVPVLVFAVLACRCLSFSRKMILDVGISCMRFLDFLKCNKTGISPEVRSMNLRPLMFDMDLWWQKKSSYPALALQDAHLCSEQQYGCHEPRYGGPVSYRTTPVTRMPYRLRNSHRWSGVLERLFRIRSVKDYSRHSGAPKVHWV